MLYATELRALGTDNGSTRLIIVGQEHGGGLCSEGGLSCNRDLRRRRGVSKIGISRSTVDLSHAG